MGGTDWIDRLLLANLNRKLKCLIDLRWQIFGFYIFPIDNCRHYITYFWLCRITMLDAKAKFYIGLVLSITVLIKLNMNFSVTTRPQKGVFCVGEMHFAFTGSILCYCLTFVFYPPPRRNFPSQSQ